MNYLFAQSLHLSSQLLFQKCRLRQTQLFGLVIHQCSKSLPLSCQLCYFLMVLFHLVHISEIDLIEMFPIFLLLNFSLDTMRRWAEFALKIERTRGILPIGVSMGRNLTHQRRYRDKSQIQFLKTIQKQFLSCRSQSPSFYVTQGIFNLQIILLVNIFYFLIDLQILGQVVFTLYKMHTAEIIHTAVTSVPLSLPANYGYVLIVASVIAFEIILIGFIFPGRARSAIFTEEFMKQNFGTQHKSATGLDIQKGGYPDMGNGVYSQRLPYKDWYAFNNAQRAHYNFVQMAPSTLVWELIAGLYFPVPAAAIGLALIICRFIYAAGYAGNGPKGRIIGALGNDLTILGLFGLSIASGAMLINGNSPV